MSTSYQHQAIVAVSQNGVIGKNGGLPWRLKEDLKWFKKITMGHTVLMGRKTWDSLPFPLPGRKNWVLSRSMKPTDEVKVFNSYEEVENALGNNEQLFIIGGSQIYTQTLSICGVIYITEVKRVIPDGDAFFPEYKNDFTAVETLDENEDFTLRKWVRKP